MRLTSFTVSKFRSITEAKKISLSDYSVLIGANNEGKSNILHALAIGMEVIENFKNKVRRDSRGRLTLRSTSLLGRQSGYNWQRDFPVSKQNTKAKKPCSEITFEFNLSETELQLFRDEIGSKLNGTLPITVSLFATNLEINIPKQGPGAATLNKKKVRIADFISRNLSFEYIPTIRTSSSASDVVVELLEKELLKIEEDPAYIEAIQKISDIQQPILDELSQSISKTIARFLPSVKAVDIKLEQNARLRAFSRGMKINVDDGNYTSLDRKGDGVKSLVVLALMRHAAESASQKNNSIVAIEEPEAHLHPKAIHELREVLGSLSKNDQIILTSHSPLFVNPTDLKSTIVVRDSIAAAANNIAEIREVLGVRLSDNLQSARLVAIVEGDDDVLILEAILRAKHPELASALDSGDLVFDALGGASNLSYKVRNYRTSATSVQCFLDNDDAGRKSVQNALSDSVIRDADYNLIIVKGMEDSELEDLLDTKVYKADFIDEFEVDPMIKPPDSKKKK